MIHHPRFTLLVSGSLVLAAACGSDPASAPSPGCASTTNIICPQDSIAAKVAAAPEGTAFRLRPGVYRLQQFSPKAGQSFSGDPGAVLSGARMLTNWVQEGSYWVHGGQTQEGEVRLASTCEASRPSCAFPEDLFIDDSILEHVANLESVTPGKWYFDYPADRVYIADDPTNRRVEISVLPWAIFSTAPGVTIENLIVEKYASPAQAAAIGYSRPGPGWIVRANEVRWNHGMGIRLGSGMQVLNNFIHHQGQLGLGGTGEDVLVEGNEIAYNNTAGFGGGQLAEAGGTKFVATDGLIVRNNYSHHNKGPGLWTDINNINCLYEGNRVEDNDWRGIFHEISYACVIRNNIVRRNGFNSPGASAFEGAGILITNSSDVEVYGNTVEDNNAAIMAVEADRGSDHPSGYGPHSVRNLSVHDNAVRQTDSGQVAGIVDWNPGTDPYSAVANNRWVRNSYVVGADTKWHWSPNGDMSLSQWQAAGQDSGSAFDDPALPLARSVRLWVPR
jgi:parallel beta-helix repeat protein